MLIEICLMHKKLANQSLFLPSLICVFAKIVGEAVAKQAGPNNIPD